MRREIRTPQKTVYRSDEDHGTVFPKVLVFLKKVIK